MTEERKEQLKKAYNYGIISEQEYNELIEKEEGEDN
jgi:hypothetical protein